MRKEKQESNFVLLPPSTGRNYNQVSGSAQLLCLCLFGASSPCTTRESEVVSSEGAALTLFACAAFSTVIIFHTRSEQNLFLTVEGQWSPSRKAEGVFICRQLGTGQRSVSIQVLGEPTSGERSSGSNRVGEDVRLFGCFPTGRV